MNCRKCGAKRITRRSAGVFSCLHCGVQPGPQRLDRGGLHLPNTEPESGEHHTDERNMA